MKKAGYIQFIRDMKSTIIFRSDYASVYELVRDWVDHDENFKRAHEYLKSIGVTDTIGRITEDLG